jgi:hypothetical protein
LAHLEELFKRLHKINMKIHPKKCEFVITLIIYLGHGILPTHPFYALLNKDVAST